MILFSTGPWTPWKLCICSRGQKMRLTWTPHLVLIHKNLKEKPGATFFSYLSLAVLFSCFIVFWLDVVHVVQDPYLESLFFFFYSASSDDQSFNKVAERVLMRLQEKLKGVEEGTVLSVGGQVNLLIQQAMDPKNLSRLFPGWKPWVWLGRIQHGFHLFFFFCTNHFNISNWHFTKFLSGATRMPSLYILAFGGWFGFFFNNLLLRSIFCSGLLWCSLWPMRTWVLGHE